jgi:hypothetical protein
VINEIVPETGLTVTHLAADMGAVEVLDVLIKQVGADVNQQEPQAGLRPLHFAATPTLSLAAFQCSLCHR